MADARKHNQQPRTTAPGTERKKRRPVSLPVVHDDEAAGHASSPADRRRIRRSRMGPRRAWVLGIIQVLIIVHIVQWLITGRTTTPIEPSESMEFTKHGVINAGLIFFSLALLTTLILGRWVCGWACHIVMLQDLCGWMMKKVGIRPKPFRSRLLIYAPLLLALYMFIWPAAFRWGVVPLDGTLAGSLGEAHWLVSGYRELFAFGGVQLPRTDIAPWQVQFELTTENFWATFPGIAIALPFLFICGFAAVYFLGAKGFCTYGCPYGGFFAPLDRYAPARIRVTDACTQCGHCTAVCTSNVRVSEEVNAYGMVVDPGCMKCMDCISVCPNEALYFGLGRPAVLKGKPISKPNVRPPTRHYDLTWPEEIALALVFLLTLLGTRGVYGSGMLPLLMAGGVAGCVTYLVHKAWQMWRDASVNLHRYRLKFKGKVQRAGWVFVSITLVIVLLITHTSIVRSAKIIAGYHDAKVLVPAHAVFTMHRTELPAATQQHAARGLWWYELGSTISAGGIGLMHIDQAPIDLRRAWLHAVNGDMAAADDVLQRAIQRDGPLAELCTARLLVLRALGEDQQALAWAAELLVQHEHLDAVLDDLVRWAPGAGHLPRVIQITRQRLAAFPEHLHTMRWLSLLLLERGDVQGGIDLIQRTLEIDPDNAAAYVHLARAWAQLGRFDEAERALRAGLVHLPDSELLQRELADLLAAMR